MLNIWILMIFFILPVFISNSQKDSRDVMKNALNSGMTMRVMTFNIRFANPGDGENAWEHRKDKAASMFRLYGVDLAGLQEALIGQIRDLENRLEGFAWIGAGRDDGKEGGEFSPIFYRTDKFKLLQQNTFWLSETPGVPGSEGWDAHYPRVCTWAKFEERTSGQVFFFFNTHFDHAGETARVQSARLLLSKIAELAGDAPVILSGDFNFQPDSEPYQIITGQMDANNLPRFTDVMNQGRFTHHGPTGTFQAFGTLDDWPRIDYIFVKEEFEVLQEATLSDHWDGLFPSDHLPVLAELKIKEN